MLHGTSNAPVSFRAKDSATTQLRKTVDFDALLIQSIAARAESRDWRDTSSLEPHSSYARDMIAPFSALDDAAAPASVTRLVGMGLGKNRAPINTITYLPDQYRLFAGSSAGDVSVWNSLTFAFERMVPAHNAGLQVMRFNRGGTYMLSGDAEGNVKYWDSSLTSFEDFRAHREMIRGIDFSPADHKYVTCSDDGLVRVWSFFCAAPTVEHELRGHGQGVNTVAWHPSKALIASGSRDSSVKLWDAGSGKEVASLAGHTGWVLQAAWNALNGWWLLTSSRDQTLRVTDIRTMREVATIASEHRGCTSLAWHPHVEQAFAAGCFDGTLQHWNVAHPQYAQAEVPHAHDSAVWDLAWHPVGHALSSCANDTTVKTWAQCRPGDTARQYAFQGNPMRCYGDNNAGTVTPVPPRLPAHATLLLGGGGGIGGAGAGAVGRAALLHAADAAAASFEALEADTRRTWASVGQRAEAVKEGAFAARAAAAGVSLAAAGSRPNFGAAAAADAGGGGGFRGGGGAGGGGGGAGGGVRPVPASYICDVCRVGGHWIDDCPTLLEKRRRRAEERGGEGGGGAGPLAGGLGSGGGGGGVGFGGVQQQQQPQAAAAVPAVAVPSGPVPAGYVCRECRAEGEHWMEACPWVLPPTDRAYRPAPPEYVCHGCGRGGHWKAACPRLSRLASLGVTGPGQHVTGPAGGDRVPGAGRGEHDGGGGAGPLPPVGPGVARGPLAGQGLGPGEAPRGGGGDRFGGGAGFGRDGGGGRGRDRFGGGGGGGPGDRGGSYGGGGGRGMMGRDQQWSGGGGGGVGAGWSGEQQQQQQQQLQGGLLAAPAAAAPAAQPQLYFDPATGTYYTLAPQPVAQEAYYAAVATAAPPAKRGRFDAPEPPPPQYAAPPQQQQQAPPQALDAEAALFGGGGYSYTY